MVSVSEATSLIGQHLFKAEKERIKIEMLEGRILAEAIKADRDFPPFDRVAMDGIAIQYQSFEEGWREFKVENLQAAGQPRTTLKDVHNCIEVMTGAMLPIGCDTVIRYEDVAIFNKLAKVKVESISKGQSIHLRSSDAKRGDTILAPGHVLSPAEIALLASVGKSDAEVLAFPPTAIVSTGNELVDIHDSPQPHQIRRSNSYAIRTALHTMGCHPALFHLQDERNALVTELTKIMASHQVIILSGGVSKGKFDLIPAALESLGVKKVFHEVSQKPGKPFWFGVTKKHAVFAFPGNPVSTFLCFYRYFLPWLAKSMGITIPSSSAILAGDFSFNLDLTYFLQVKINNEGGRLMATPFEGGGSGDFANLKDADGFIELPADKNSFKAGEAFPFIPYR
ncbi:MAG: molybdopterin molybdotransferase MoeA [Cyclobacteriaceae bacterium]|nr:molybdopterin molybdotransferase MoeA [Cyclobacteriaceae bacterium]